MRTGCEAMLRIALNTKCNTWYVNEFKDHHNHDMVPPRKQVFMKSNKVFPPATTNLAEASSKHTVQAGVVASLFEDNSERTTTLDAGSVHSEMAATFDVGSVHNDTTTNFDVESVPILDMEFHFIEEAGAFYKEYGRSMGFSTRKRSSYATGRGPQITRVIFVCRCEGIHKKQVDSSDDDGKKKRNTTSMRTGCEAMIRIALNTKHGTWYVNAFKDDHNHDMVPPEEGVLMKSNKDFPPAPRNLAKAPSKRRLQLRKVGPPFGDNENTESTPRDVYNHLRTIRESLIEVGDAEAVMIYFRKKTIENPGFYYAVQVDEEGRAASFFWVDARSRIAYSRFGDAVTFDTTCRANKYSMPFAPFTGTNHYHQSVTFGFALLRDETEETFTWLFKTWLEATGGNPPISILTDQDQDMTSAIATVFLSSRHCFCSGHIKKKFGEKLSHVFYKKSKFKKTVKAVTRFTYTTQEFENQWEAMLREFGLVEDVWLHDLFEIREKWIPAYNRGTFFAGMNSTQRSDSIISFFDHSVNSRTCLLEFVESCGQALERMYIRERYEDYKSIHVKRIFASQDLLVKHASPIYTKNMFMKVHEQFNASSRYRSEAIEADGDEETYRVYSLNDEVPMEQFRVKINKVTQKGVCGCQEYEFIGISCRHLHHILVYRYYVVEIPSHFIKQRWTKYANRPSVLGNDELLMKDHKLGTEAMRISHYCRRSTELAYILGKSKKAYDVTMGFLDQAFEKVKEIDIDELGAEYGKDGQLEEYANDEPSETENSCDAAEITRRRVMC
ncbi:protein FAR1-RELATED SEQUENCE 5-like [Papaver somniferum]|uniref:protein FAR1-RELATED SEQUENCE 5-like n=1 Tax=Papaver somniferum TaxID=3469 RepID=UPI000E6F8D93|nr:protein FAR1-RELATED SEQUENCE 5-like [Papaver somniferum]